MANQSNQINTIHDSLKTLTRRTEKMLDNLDRGKEINTEVENATSRRYDVIARHAAQLIAERKQSGSKDRIPFFDPANNAQP